MDPRENADLERRVQAHEELLTALIGAVGKEHPAILTRLEGMFAERRDGGGQEYADTVARAAQILRTARREVGAN
jgi:hypothetical protein